jgi:hypothetical protein
MLFGCIDYNKLSGSLKMMIAFNLDFGFNEFDLESYLIKLISDKCNSDPRKKQLLISLVGKSKPIVNCIKYLVNDLETLADNCKQFGNVEDDVF